MHGGDVHSSKDTISDPGDPGLNLALPHAGYGLPDRFSVPQLTYCKVEIVVSASRGIHGSL